MNDRRCQGCGVRVGWLGTAVSAGLVGIKLFVGHETGSRALMADALYSLIDVVSALLVLGSFKASRQGADARHAYGHGKVEFLAVAAISAVIAALAVAFLIGAVDDLVQREAREVHPIAAAVALFSVAACYVVYRYARCAGRQLNSPVLATHAVHNRADMISSAAVVLSVALSWVGLGVLDPLVALVEIADVLHMSLKLLRRGVDGLLDATVDDGRIGEIARLARQVPGVLRVMEVRVRNIGTHLRVELDVAVVPTMRMAEVAGIRRRVAAEVRVKVEAKANVVVDVLPAPPETGAGGLVGIPECEAST